MPRPCHQKAATPPTHTAAVTKHFAMPVCAFDVVHSWLGTQPGTPAWRTFSRLLLCSTRLVGRCRRAQWVGPVSGYAEYIKVLRGRGGAPGVWTSRRRCPSNKNRILRTTAESAIWAPRMLPDIALDGHGQDRASQRCGGRNRERFPRKRLPGTLGRERQIVRVLRTGFWGALTGPAGGFAAGSTPP